MKKYNLSMEFTQSDSKADPVIVMLCFEAPDSVSLAKLNQAMSAAFFSVIETGKCTGNTNLAIVLTQAMKMVDDALHTRSFVIQAHMHSKIKLKAALQK